jgi:hypothetical protein
MNGAKYKNRCHQGMLKQGTLTEGKALYSSHTRTCQFRSAPFVLKILSTIYTKQTTLKGGQLYPTFPRS